MIISAESVNSGEVIESDLCIVGAGPAGLTIARQFVGTDHRVYVLESGGEQLDESARDLADGDVIGHPYFSLAEARAYVVGGSSHLWGEWMRARPLDPIDFEARPWVAASGWPFGREELDPFYETANKILGLGPFEYSVTSSDQKGLGEGGDVRPIVFRYSNTFDFERTKQEIDASDNVCLVLNATALELELRRDGSAVERAVVSSENPQRFHVAARLFVLAAGGLENARLLLLSRGGSPNGLANSSGLVGTHFMEHPTMRSGIVVPTEPVRSGAFRFFRREEKNGSAVRGALAPSHDAMERREVLNGMVLLTETTRVRASEALRSAAIVREALQGNNSSGESGVAHLFNLAGHPRELFDLWRARREPPESEQILRVSVTIEQVPQPSSRVVLGQRRDRFGQPVVALDWRLSDIERRTVRTLQELVDSHFRARGLGHLEGFLGEERPPRMFRGEWHQLGTTRMSASPRSGVVDPDGRAHDLPNLYIAGGSVFPTVGFANPTLTIVALSLRLARALETPLRRTVSLGSIW